MKPSLASLQLWSVALVFLLQCLSSSLGVELTFELPDNAKECFHEVIEKDTSVTVEFQVRSDFPIS